MFKIFSSVLISTLLFIAVQTTFANEVPYPYDKSQNTYDVSDEYNFTDSSYYLTDEQLQDAQEIDEIDDKSSFEAKVINSSHFSSGTATRTWIPINKIK